MLRSGKHCMASRARRTMTKGMIFMTVFVAFLQLQGCCAEVKKFDMMLMPESSLIHYTSGFLRGPGEIDLNGLNFTAVSPSLASMIEDVEDILDFIDDEYYQEQDDDEFNNDDDQGNDGGGRNLYVKGGVEGLRPSSRRRRRQMDRKLQGLGDDNTTTSTLIDLLITRIAANNEDLECATSEEGCDWTQLGIGHKDDNGLIHYCCTEDAETEGICDQAGRIILSDSYNGATWTVEIPNEGPAEAQFSDAVYAEDLETGQYLFVLANCALTGRVVNITGPTKWTANSQDDTTINFNTELPTFHAHWMTGHLLSSPGRIDATQLAVTAISDLQTGDESVHWAYDPQSVETQPTSSPTEAKANEDNGDGNAGGGGGDGGGDGFLPPPGGSGSGSGGDDDGDDDDGLGGKTMIDIAVFREPSSCAFKSKGCDWTELGVGARTEDGGKQWCCIQELVEIGKCTEPGRLLIDIEIFEGNHRFVEFEDNDEDHSEALRYAGIDEAGTGQYIVIFANCNPLGREVEVTGKAVWKSKHGFLPGELFGFMYFYWLLALLYFVLVGWYAVSMICNVASRIPIEKWILMTLTLGMIEMMARSVDYILWNREGSRYYSLGYLGLLVGILKQGISRCLILMVSMGWGVTRDSLGSAMCPILSLGIAYFATATADNFLYLFALEGMQTLSSNEEEGLFDFATLLQWVGNILNVTFVVWILVALCSTLGTLSATNQTRKRERFNALSLLFIVYVTIAIINRAFLYMADNSEQSVVVEEHAWLFDAFVEANFLFVVTGVACLWRPNPSAKEYAYALQLGDEDDEEAELELTVSVPSAANDNNGSGTYSGFRDSKGHDDRFQIDD